jgi:putative transcriptional regulator
MRRAGVLAEPAYTKITKRHLREQPTIHPLSGNEIKALRQRARMSQAVFAHHLNVTPAMYRNWNLARSGRLGSLLRS